MKKDIGKGDSRTSIEYLINRQYTSIAVDFRVNTLVIHHTALDFDKSLYELMGRDRAHWVSVHYLVADKIAGNAESYVYQLVNENLRAWHAGLGYWNEQTDVNSTSIGIEIVNLDGNLHPYPEEQIQAVIQLAKRVVYDYNIDPTHVIGHSDLAPARRDDPGCLFPWQRLYNEGIGAWPDQADVEQFEKQPIPDIKTVQTQFRNYGYGINITNVDDDQTKKVITAFQRHFRQAKVDGVLDIETYAILRALLKKYKNQQNNSSPSEPC